MVESTRKSNKKTGGKDPKPPEAPSLKRLPTHEIYPVDRLSTTTTNEAVELAKINEIAQMLWISPSLSDESKNALIVRAMELYRSLKPEDGAEGMLAAQMVGTHSAAMECLRRAALPEQTFAGRDLSLKHAQKLMALYAKQLETLNKHRGKGQQKVTVEHVNVAPGGQAIVGNVEADTKSKGEQTSPAIAHTPQVPMETVKSPEKAKAPKSGK
ncbi:MAG: hypothetical protein GKR97_18185 [Rhizobiaceae bacterium]|nr:hypothetical protein [Rhizobiaceae bacterium]